jgi:uncharacterized membrane protein
MGGISAKPDVMRRLFLAIAMMCPVFLAGPAHAAFNVCNQTGLPARVALGRFDGTNWTSQGWWMIAPKSCAGLLTGPLQARYYYLYATDGAAGTWEGKTGFCVAPDSKFLTQRGSCAKRGLDRRGFFEIDTGRASDWTQTLSN